MSHSSQDPLERAGGYEFSRIRLRGEIDATTAPAVAERLRSLPAGTDVEVDLSHVRFINSAGLTVLLELRRHLAKEGAVLHLTGASAFIDRLLVLVGLRAVLPHRFTHRAVPHTEPSPVLADRLDATTPPRADTSPGRLVPRRTGPSWLPTCRDPRTRRCGGAA